MTRNLFPRDPTGNTDSLLRAIGADTLAQWQREVRAGTRRVADIDDLARAACHEMNARDAERDRLPRIARTERDKVAGYIMRALTEEAA